MSTEGPLQNRTEQVAARQKEALRETDQVLREVRAARARQIAKWGWARSQEAWDTDPVAHAHDDSHVAGDWTRFIVRFLGKAERAIEDDNPYDWREEMLCVAALAAAAIESHDRKQRRDDAHHIRSAKHPERTLCGQDASKLNTLPPSTTVWPDANAACWTCWDMQRQLLAAESTGAI